MSTCEVCGNDYDKTLEITFQGKTHTFDCFECAIQALAPVCNHCGCKVIGHGVESGGKIYCCASCAFKEGVPGLKDRVEFTSAESVTNGHVDIPMQSFGNECSSKT